MSVRLSYLFVVIIWSTTPLGIVWSSDSIPATMAVFLRMFIALILGGMIVIIAKIQVPWHRQALTLYSYSALGIFGGMLLSYQAAQTVSSGLISLLFGLAPIISGILAQRMLNEPKFTKIKICALVLSLFGLYLVCAEQMSHHDFDLLGFMYLFMAVICFSVSGILVKRVNLAIHPMATTIGALTIATPLFFLSWLLFDGSFNPTSWHSRAILSVLYLGIFGSLLGFLAYFHVLQKLQASTVALITLLTPGFAIALGALLNGEMITSQLIIGASLILLSLALFQFGDNLSTKLPTLIAKKKRN